MKPQQNALTMISAHSKIRVQPLQDLWQHRRVIVAMTRLRLRQRYHNSLSGWLLSLVPMLLATGIYTTVFTEIHHQSWKPVALVIVPQLILWYFFQEVVAKSVYGLGDFGKLIKSSGLRAEAVPWIITSAAFLHFLALTGVWLLIKTLVWQQLHLGELLWLLGGLLLCTALCYSVSLGICYLATLYRDLRQMVPILMTLLFFTTPIIIPKSTISSPLLHYASYLPIHLLLESMNQPNWEQAFPSILGLTLWIVLLLSLSAWVFRSLAVKAVEAL